ncbi:hypothetical protein B0H13DRAFT_2194357 [Mycena leptocephala]|nr:hypothetical protein B0H13DRAFT_2194357 [Mycena leptocephala]
MIGSESLHCSSNSLSVGFPSLGSLPSLAPSATRRPHPSLLMTDPVAIIIDDQALPAHSLQNTLTVGFPGGWYTGFNSCYNGSVFIPQATDGAIWGWALQFEGASVSLFGITPPSQYNQTIGIADPGSDKDIIAQPKDYHPYMYPSAAFGGQFYTSGTLPAPGQMLLGLSNANGIMIDYALVTASNSTSFQGQTIIVDDASPEIFWDGSWSAQDNFTMPDVSFTANMSPHANTSHRSSSVGASFTFQFAGTSLLVSGITPGVVDAQADWLLKMEFTLDGNTTTNVFTPGADLLVKPHFVYFTTPFDAETGNHTLVAKVVDAVGSPPPAARIDYITYRPSFATIADKPNFPPPAASATGPTGAPSASSATAIQHRSSVGAIVGGVIGGCLLLALLVGAFWLLRQRRTKEREQLAPEPFVSSATPQMHERNGRSKQELLSGDGNTLAERRNNLAAEIQNLEESRNGEMFRGEEQSVDERLRVLQAQMDTLTLEMRQYLDPPSYT